MKPTEIIKLIVLSPFVLIYLILAFPIMVIRALVARKPKSSDSEQSEIKMDKEKIVEHTVEAIKIPTISMTNEYEGKDEPFLKFQEFLRTAYPNINAAAERTIINDYSVVYHFKGSDKSLKPCAFLAHQDVVPAPEKGWDVPPFEGVIKDNYIYGRGTQDMKGTLISLMEGMEQLLADGFQPKRDVYFCFGHDEETFTTNGAKQICKWLDEQGIKLEFVMDEGGIIVDKQVVKAVGVEREIGLIATSEKGHTNVRLRLEKAGGHASNPKYPSAACLLSKALIKIEKHPMPSVWTKSQKELFSTLAPHFPFWLRLVLANRAILSPILTYAFKKIPLTNSLISTTFAITQLKGSEEENVIPPMVEANINTRIVTGTTVKQVEEYVQKLVGKDIVVDTWDSTEATLDSDTKSESYLKLKLAIERTFKDIIVAPYMFIANDDARYYQPIAENIYRFTPFVMNLSDQERIHALNERVSTNAMEKASKFFYECITLLC